VKVVDFGIAKALGADAANLTSERGLGTSPTSHPNNPRTDVDGRADVYALAAISTRC